MLAIKVFLFNLFFGVLCVLCDFVKIIIGSHLIVYPTDFILVDVRDEPTSSVCDSRYKLGSQFPEAEVAFISCLSVIMVLRRLLMRIGGRRQIFSCWKVSDLLLRRMVGRLGKLGNLRPHEALVRTWRYLRFVGTGSLLEERLIIGAFVSLLSTRLIVWLLLCYPFRASSFLGFCRQCVFVAVSWGMALRRLDSLSFQRRIIRAGSLFLRLLLFNFLIGYLDFFLAVTVGEL